jgi:hypothetical protein
MTMRFRTLAVVALAAGILAGLIAALAVPQRSAAKREPRPIKVLPERPRSFAPGLLQIVPVPGTVRIEAWRADPRGGPPFALRVFKAKRLVLPVGSHDLSRGRLLGHPLCAQLGRIYRGRFGWLDAQNEFRPVIADYFSAPIVCPDRWRDARSDPALQMTTLVTDPLRQIANPRQTIAWGIAGGLARSVHLDGVPAAEQSPELSRRGAFIAFAQTGASPFETKATFTYDGRPAVTDGFGGHYGEIPGPPHGPLAQRIQPGTERIEARAPDPAGGLTWALAAARTTSGNWCDGNQPGRLVGTRLGGVQFGLGTFAEDPPMTHCFMAPDALNRRRPVGIGWGGLGDDYPGDVEADPALGRTQLRTLKGRSYLMGITLPDVAEVTVASPRDVRTVIPSRRAHVFLVVYDGSFPTGDFVVTAKFTDGTHTRQRVPAGF